MNPSALRDPVAVLALRRSSLTSCTKVTAASRCATVLVNLMDEVTLAVAKKMSWRLVLEALWPRLEHRLEEQLRLLLSLVSWCLLLLLLAVCLLLLLLPSLLYMMAPLLLLLLVVVS